MSTVTTPNAWKERERRARLLAAVVAQQRHIAERLIRYRAENARAEDRKGRLPQEIAAARADVSPRQWQRWEGCQTLPHQGNIEKLARNLQIPVAEFFAPERATEETPDLLGRLDREVPDDLQAQLDEIKASNQEVLRAIDELKQLVLPVIALLEPGPEEEDDATDEEAAATEKRAAAS